MPRVAGGVSARNDGDLRFQLGRVEIFARTS